MCNKEKVFFGSACAMVTPFKNGEIDYSAFGKLIDYQIENGTDAIVVLGTTGEAPTISEAERGEIVAFAKNRINGRTPLIVGTGTNSTESTVRYSKNAHSLGANAILCVTPYYNKPTENGLVEHYKAVADSVDIPVILYNVPSRTGVNLSVGALEKLKDIPNIVGIKEASGSIGYFDALVARFGDYYHFYTGNDELTLSSLACGGDGVISVVGNVLPKEMHILCQSFKNGDIEKSREIQHALLPLIKELFYEVNPVPVKTALNIMGLIENELRLPLVKSTRYSEIKTLISKYLKQ
ncbi:MAG: 4-hydroxy-tetrahydrodipicolinate synthase [Ruminococcaceae bacterium]|nr:4-hydroxy-tetrahydrodipicolinate synthase [Oscillospiraceae bacterium]